jgi:tetratricopeptide (TPR) repeat protein
MAQNLELKRLLTEGINSVAKRRCRSVGSVEEDIGEAVNVTRHAVQRWKRGYAPPSSETIELIASYCLRFGRVDKAWARSLLRQALHPNPQAVLDHLFPSTADSARVVHNLPARHGPFIGRETEIERLFEWVNTPGEPLICIEGIGGVGKTRLALEISHRCISCNEDSLTEPFYAVIWTTDQGDASLYPPLKGILDTIARELDCRHLLQLQVENEALEVKRLLQRHRVLIIIDNFESMNDRNLISFLEEVPEPSKVLVTTRYTQLGGMWQHISLGGLTNEQALELIREHSHRIGLSTATVDNNTLDYVAAATDNNPKAIQLLLGLIKQKALPFNTVVGELYSVSQTVKEVFDYIFAEAWESLGSEARRVLLTMPLFISSDDPARTLSHNLTYFPASRDALSAVSGVSDDELTRAVEQLAGMSLLEVSGALDPCQQRYRIHPLTRAFAQSKLPADTSFDVVPATTSDAEKVPLTLSELKSRFYTFFAGWCKDKAGRDYWGIFSWKEEQFEYLYLEMPNLLLSLDWAYERQDWASVLVLAKTLVHPVRYQGQFVRRIRCSEYGIKASRELGDVEDRIWFIIDGLGLAYHQSGDHERARQLISQGLEQARDQDLPNAISWGEVLLSLEALRMDDLADANTHADEALKHAEAFYAKYRAYRAAGHVARRRHKYDKAEEYYLKSRRFLEVTEYRSSVDFYLGLTYVGLERYEEAEDLFHRTLEAHRKYGDQRMIARAKYGLAQVYATRAEQLYRNSVDLAKEAREVFTLSRLQLELDQTEELLRRLSTLGK